MFNSCRASEDIRSAGIRLHMACIWERLVDLSDGINVECLSRVEVEGMRNQFISTRRFFGGGWDNVFLH